MQVNLMVQRKDQPPQMAHIPRPVIDCCDTEEMTMALVEGGMASGEPSVIFIVTRPDGSVLMQTSLDKFLASASALQAMAKTHLGWEQQEGSFTMMPSDNATRKLVLEALKKDLEEWDDTLP